MGSVDTRVDSIVRDDPQCTPIKTKIIHIGCGASGILFTHKVRKWLTNFELTIYEKNPLPGGTWYENRYPGCACDVPAHTYTFPFEPNPEWSAFYSGAGEIQDYMLRTAAKWNVNEYTVFNTEVTSTRWIDETGTWEVQLKNSEGKEFTDSCNILINGCGVVNKWKWPAVEGLHDFRGSLVHSAAWDDTIEWADKKVAIIGSGSSSIQMVPKLGSTAKHMTVFVRNPTYVGPMLTSHQVDKDVDPDAPESNPEVSYIYSEKERQKFREDPDYLLAYRKAIERSSNAGFPIFIRGSPFNLGFTQVWRQRMEEKLGDRKDLRDFLIPKWSPGCRRLSPGNLYLETLVQENVTVCSKEITKVVPEGIISADGTLHELDLIVCATGFNVQYLPHFRVTGTMGQIMQDQAQPNVYASIGVPGFPNYFIVNGPRGNWGQGCALPSHEVQIEYILKCCKKMQEDRIKSMVPKSTVTTQMNEYMDAWHREKSIWAEDCRSWYKDNKVGGRVYIWPGSMMHHLKYLKHPRFEHYDYEYLDSNMFGFLGNGFTIAEDRSAKEGTELPVDFLRHNEDTVWDIE